jgi:DNA-binding beta-propeller fold protein YncE
VSRRGSWILAILGALACSAGQVPASPEILTVAVQQTHSGSLAVNGNRSLLFVAHPDADSVSVISLATRLIQYEVLLAGAPPAKTAAGRYEPAVGPRALALDSTASTLYVTGQRSGYLYAIDVSSGSVKGNATVCSEPIGVLVSSDDANVFVACAQDDEVVEVRASDMTRTASATCPRKPWALAWAADGQTLLATHLLGGSPGGPPPATSPPTPATGPGVSVFTTTPLALKTTWNLADGAPRTTMGMVTNTDGEDPTEPHGQVRGIYDAVVRPGTSELWVAHLMLGTDTAQPVLDFQETVFPSLSILDDRGSPLARLSVSPNPGDGEAFGDIVSGPRALTFSDDGKLAFIVDADSEDVLVVDAQERVETQLIRPLPGHLPEGIVWAGGEIYVQERNTEDIAAFRVSDTDAGVSVVADGPAFSSLAVDPMPKNLRLGQQLFFSANSDDLPLTQNHWVACASCHLEGRIDAVTWRFLEGPRDTPTNAGGLLDTGFLFHTADRRQVQDYWRTINVEQGGNFNIDRPTQKPLLDDLAAYVNYAIPTPIPPSTDMTHSVRGAALASLRAQGETLFERIGCIGCHSGEARTDSGAGNPTLDLSGPTVSILTPGGVLLHDVGTCETTGPFPDVAHDDIDGDSRAACAFDTPALRGVWDSAPYFHDGSAATLEDVLPVMLRAVIASGRAAPVLSTGDQEALIEYLRSL